jgi:hypothetical protein
MELLEQIHTQQTPLNTHKTMTTIKLHPSQKKVFITLVCLSIPFLSVLLALATQPSNLCEVNHNFCLEHEPQKAV